MSGDDLELVNLAQTIKPVVGSIERATVNLKSALSRTDTVECTTAVVRYRAMYLELDRFLGLYTFTKL